MTRGHLKRPLCGVGQIAIRPLGVALRDQREPGRRVVGTRVPLGIERPEEEHLVSEDGTTHRDTEVAALFISYVGAAVSPVGEAVAARFQPLALEKPEDRPGDQVRAALGDDVHQAAGRLAELGLVAAGLHLDLIDELGRDALTQPAIGAGVDAQRPEPVVGDIHAIDVILVVEPGAASDRGIRAAGQPARADAWCQIERVAELPTGRDLRQHVGVDRAADLGRGDVDDRSCRDDLHHLGDRADAQHEPQLDPTAQPDGDAALLDRAESRPFQTERVRAWCQKGRQKLAVRAGDVGLDAAIRGHRNRHTRQHRTGAVDDRAADRSGRVLLRGGHSGGRKQQNGSPRE